MAKAKVTTKETGEAHDALSSAEKARAYLAALEGDDAAAKVAADGGDDEALAAARERIEAAEAEKEADPAAQSDPAVQGVPGTVRVKHPGKASSFGWGAHAYTPDAKGVFTLPDAALQDALSHGFERA